MRINVKLLKDVIFEAKNQDNNTIIYDSAPAFGGQGKGFRPMEAILSSLASCSGIDIVNMLRKGRHEVTDFSVTVTGKRREEPLPKIFTDIHLHFEISGSFPESAMMRAVQLSVEKYCSVGNMLKDAVNITFDAVKSDLPEAITP